MSAYTPQSPEIEYLKSMIVDDLLDMREREKQSLSNLLDIIETMDESMDITIEELGELELEAADERANLRSIQDRARNDDQLLFIMRHMQREHPQRPETTLKAAADHGA